MSEWPLVQLREVCDLLAGYPFPSREFTDLASDVRLLRGDNVAPGRLRWNGAKRWPTSHLDGFGSYQLKRDDVILAMDRPWIEAGLKCARVREDDLPSLLVQRVARLRGGPRLDTRYLRWVMADRAFTHHILAVQTGTTIPHISADQILAYEFRLPPLPEQVRVAGVLGALDDKIESNQRISETLRLAAGTFYRSIASRASSEATIGDVADVIDCLHSKKPDKRETGRPLLQLGNIRDDGLLDLADPYLIDESDYALWTSRIEAQEGDCVITNVGRVGAVAQVPVGTRAALGRNMTAVRCRFGFPYPTFLLEALLSDQMRDEITLRTDAGTILDALNVRNIPRLRLPLPSVAELEAFERRVRPMRGRMEQALAESRSLAAVRDALLPRLLSGELEVAV